jgi:hypothetical protein
VGLYIDDLSQTAHPGIPQLDHSLGDSLMGQIHPLHRLVILK